MDPPDTSQRVQPRTRETNNRRQRRERRQRRAPTSVPTSKQPLDFYSLTDFRSRLSASDVRNLIRQSDAGNSSVSVVKTRDSTGLLPIHWASIHNRPDLIELLIEMGSPLRDSCANELFCNATCLHLAAANGSIEAAAALLELDSKNRKPADDRDVSELTRTDDRSQGDWLSQRDSQGHTCLMRTAAPRSKRLDLIRDLLGKNLWSLSGRPAEMALFLMAKGADWRVKEPNSGMDLFFLAILNDYDDIVCLLLNVDPTVLEGTVNLGDQEPRAERINVPSDSDSSSASQVKLFDRRHWDSASSPIELRALIEPESARSAREVIRKGLTPLDMALIYGRTHIINLVRSSEDLRRLRKRPDTTIINATIANPTELRRSVKSMALRLCFVLDLFYMVFIWVPIYLLGQDHERLRFLSNLNAVILILCITWTVFAAYKLHTIKPGYLDVYVKDYYRLLKQILATNNARFREQTNEATSSVKTVSFAEPKKDPGEVEKKLSTNIEQKDDNKKRPKFTDDQSLIDACRSLCHKCATIRKPRTRHCNYCNGCVIEFDHHCIYLNRCIGRDNRTYFLFMLIGFALMGLYSLFYQSSLPEQGGKSASHYLSLVIGVINLVTGSLGSYCVLRRAASGVTQYEEIRSRRIRKIFGSRGPPEEVSRRHQGFSIKPGSFWRYAPDRFLTGDLTLDQITNNLKEFFRPAKPDR